MYRVSYKDIKSLHWKYTHSHIHAYIGIFNNNFLELAVYGSDMDSLNIGVPN